MITASLLQKGVSPVLVILIVLVVGILFGTVQGVLIQKFKLHPWIVTLAGMFFARGASYVISIDTIIIDDPFFTSISSYRISILPGAFISINSCSSSILYVEIHKIWKNSLCYWW
jgi:simple sugar transport system permease protein